MDIEINGKKQAALFRNGKYEHTFIPTVKDEEVRLYHMGCNGSTKIAKLQLERGTDVTFFERPYEKANSLSGIFKQLRDLDIEMRDETSEFWGRLKLNNKGFLTEFKETELNTILAATAEGISNQVKRDVDNAVSNFNQKYNEISASVSSFENDVLKKSEVSVTKDGITLGAGKKVDGKTLTSLLVTNPDNIQAITDRMVITPTYDNIANFEKRETFKLDSNEMQITPYITHDNLKRGDEFVVKGLLDWEGQLTNNLILRVETVYKDGAIHNEDFLIREKGSTQQGLEFLDKNILVEWLGAANNNVEKYCFKLLMNENTNPVTISNLKITKKKDAELLVDGSIQGKHLGVSTIEAANIKFGAIKGTHIQAEAIEGTHLKVDDGMINKLMANEGFIDTLFSKNAFINNLKTVKINTTQLEGHTLDGVILTGRSQIRVGDNGYFEPYGTGVRFVLPHSNSFNSSGVGVQFNAVYNSLGKGLSVFNINDIQNPNEAKPIYDETLMTVHGQIKMGFPFFDNRIKKFSNLMGSVVVSNVSNNNPVHPWGYRGNPTYSKISWIGWLWGAEGGSRIMFGYPYENNSNYFAVRIGETYSDQKLKENINPTTVKALDLIEKLQFKRFDWRKEYKETGSQKPVKLGLIAQDVQRLDDSLVTKSPDILEIEHFRLSMYAIKGVQELMEQNKELLQKIERLEDKINGK